MESFVILGGIFLFCVYFVFFVYGFEYLTKNPLYAFIVLVALLGTIALQIVTAADLVSTVVVSVMFIGSFVSLFIYYFRVFLKRRKISYLLFMMLPLIFIYIGLFTNGLYCLKCIATLNTPTLNFWNGSSQTSVYHYNCFENTEEHVYWLFESVNKLRSSPDGGKEIEVITNTLSANFDICLFYDMKKTNYFRFVKFKEPDAYAVIRVEQKMDNIQSQKKIRYDQSSFADSIVYRLNCVNLDFNTLESMYFNCTRESKTKENFTDIWKNMKDKTLVIVHYFNYGEYFKVEFPNRKKE